MTQRQDIDSVEEHRVTVALQHARYEQQLWRYHNQNVHGRVFNMGNMVLRRVVIAIIWLGQKVGREQDGLKG
jgi:hypothetical protein